MKRHLALALGAFLFSSVPGHAAQFVEIHAQLTAKHWSVGNHPTGGREVKIRTVVGTNRWFLEGSFFTPVVLNQIWFTGTNFVQSEEITKIPATRTGKEIAEVYRRPPVIREGDSFPIRDMAYVSWMAFLSGPYIKAGGRDFLLPFAVHAPVPAMTLRTDARFILADRTVAFADELGLPRVLSLHDSNGIALCEYSVTRSTNVLGWNVPLEFKLSQNGGRPGRTEVVGTVKSISPAKEPVVPPEVMHPPAP